MWVSWPSCYLDLDLISASSWKWCLSFPGVSAGISQSHYKCYRNKELKMEIRNYTDPERAGRAMPRRLQLEDPRHNYQWYQPKPGTDGQPGACKGEQEGYNKSKMVLQWLSSWRGLESHGHSPQSRVMTYYTSACKSHVSPFHWHTCPLEPRRKGDSRKHDFQPEMRVKTTGIHPPWEPWSWSKQ